MDFTKLEPKDAIGTYKVGETITTSRAELDEIFGDAADLTADHDKVDYEWNIKFEDGTIAAIYDWKNDMPLLDNEEYEFNIGGRDVMAAIHVNDAIREHRGEL